MKVSFKDLKVGDRFRVSESEFIKIDDKIYGGRLSERPANVINSNNNHRVVFGIEVLVDKIPYEEADK